MRSSSLLLIFVFCERVDPYDFIAEKAIDYFPEVPRDTSTGIIAVVRLLLPFLFIKSSTNRCVKDQRTSTESRSIVTGYDEREREQTSTNRYGRA